MSEDRSEFSFGFPSDLRNEALKRIEGVRDLPTLPAVVQHVMAMARDINVSFKELKQVIIADPPLAAKILKVANSAYYARRVKATSIDNALVTIGLQQVINICASMGIMKALDQWEAKILDRENLWRHALSTGFLAKGLELRRPGKSKEKTFDIFLSGLLHNIGWIVIDYVFHDKMRQILKTAEEVEIWTMDYEVDILGMDHAELGSMFLDKWGLGKDICQVVANHHNPVVAGTHSSDAAIVQAAAFLSPYSFRVEPHLAVASPELPHRLEQPGTAEGLDELRQRYEGHIKQAAVMAERLFGWIGMKSSRVDTADIAEQLLGGSADEEIDIEPPKPLEEPEPPKPAVEEVAEDDQKSETDAMSELFGTSSDEEEKKPTEKPSSDISSVLTSEVKKMVTEEVQPEPEEEEKFVFFDETAPKPEPGQEPVPEPEPVREPVIEPAETTSQPSEPEQSVIDQLFGSNEETPASQVPVKEAAPEPVEVKKAESEDDVINQLFGKSEEEPVSTPVVVEPQQLEQPQTDQETTISIPVSGESDDTSIIEELQEKTEPSVPEPVPVPAVEAEPEPTPTPIPEPAPEPEPEPEPKPAQPQAPAPLTVPKGDGPYLLLLNVDASSTEKAEPLLARSKFRVSRVDELLQAVKLMKQELPDVLVVGIDMPPVDLAKILKSVQGLNLKKYIPIVGVSPVEQADNIHTCQEYLDDWLLSPFEPKELLIRCQGQRIMADRIKQLRSLERMKVKARPVDQVLLLILHHLNNSLVMMKGRSKLTDEANPVQVNRFIREVNDQSERMGNLLAAMKHVLSVGKAKKLMNPTVDGAFAGLEQNLRKRLLLMEKQYGTVTKKTK